MSRIVQVANFVTPSSGGLRTTLGHLATGYAQAGHEVIQVLPGPIDQDLWMPWGRQLLRRSQALPGTGYRVLRGGENLTGLLNQLAPDRLEVHDRTTLRGLGRWASNRGVGSLVVSHERLDRWLEQWLPRQLPLKAMADRYNDELAARFDVVLCTTAWAAAEFERIPAAKLIQVPLGVDLGGLHPRNSDSVWREQQLGGAQHLLVMASRLSREKRPGLAIETVAELVRRGSSVRLLVAGSGPMSGALERQSAGLPVSFLGHLSEREHLARLLASADVLLAPGPVETFGLAALEALASGTSVIVNRASALPEVIGDSAGRSAKGRPEAFADAVVRELAVPLHRREAAARARAEHFPWARTVSGFLRAHNLPAPAAEPLLPPGPVLGGFRGNRQEAEAVPARDRRVRSG
ncbi:MAG: glycosyltransferase [Actinomycetota bacterium]|nr:glycosyltransferase [Actinomycetota bacterium]